MKNKIRADLVVDKAKKRQTLTWNRFVVAKEWSLISKKTQKLSEVNQKWQINSKHCVAICGLVGQSTGLSVVWSAGLFCRSIKWSLSKSWNQLLLLTCRLREQAGGSNLWPCAQTLPPEHAHLLSSECVCGLSKIENLDHQIKCQKYTPDKYYIVEKVFPKNFSPERDTAGSSAWKFEAAHSFFMFCIGQGESDFEQKYF